MKNKLKIYSIQYNSPNYIYLQNKSFNKHIKTPYEFIIINNAVNDNKIKEIQKISEGLGLQHIHTKNDINKVKDHSSDSHAYALNFLLSDVIKDDDIVMILDHDIFLIEDLDETYYKNYDIIYTIQKRSHIEYPWAGFIVINKVKNKSDMSFNLCIVDNNLLDTGGSMYFYLKKHKLNSKIVKELFFNDETPLRYSIIDDKFLHIVAGCDWNPFYNLNEKLQMLKEKFSL
jgi:hypothetical protein